MVRARAATASTDHRRICNTGVGGAEEETDGVAVAAQCGMAE